ncbi:hypothetical protein [Microbacterium sp. CFBP9034]|uniref:hypothetical protein n=1 Tax=Microbacterium sp. CFBP9034 TaxID=3096540 RepID=UPI002A699FCE|nr:hypothetical protein [Microbacterium sp. CFBP9034]MDY0909474.1 hypothetical protein [Microbacterium sp. CFBP9034]
MAESTEPTAESAPNATDAVAIVPAETAVVDSESKAPAAPDAGDEAPETGISAPEPGPERVGRGILLSLLIIPAGVLAWTIIWQLGFMSAIVAFGVAVGAAWLYRRGSGGRIGAVGIAATIVVTLVTLVLAFLAGIAADLATFLEIDLLTAIGSAEFWDLYVLNVTDNPELWEQLTPDILFALLFAALGTFSVFWNLAKAAKAAKAAKQADAA